MANRIQGARSLVLERSRELGLRGVTSDDAGLYTCHECGSQWPARERTRWWPVSVRLSPLRYWLRFAVWGAQIGSDGIEQRVFTKFVRVGPITIRFGWEDRLR